MTTNGGQPVTQSETELVAAELTELLAPVYDRRHRLLARRDLVMAELRDIDAAVRTLDRVIKASETDTSKPKAAKQKTKRTSQETLDRVVGAMETDIAYSMGELARMLHMSETTISMALTQERNRGSESRIRLAGFGTVVKGRAPRMYKRIGGKR